MPWDEDSLHRYLLRRARPAVLCGPPGHDAAVLRGSGGRVVTCTDQVLEGVHYEPGTSARRIGEKAVGRVLSDLAATAAVPVAVSVALCAPSEAKEATLRGILAAIDRRAREFGAELVGGDLAAAAGPVHVTVHGIGRFPARGTPPHRSRARAGQVLVITGPTGGSLLGRHLRIEPRVAAGQWLYARGATALMDVSDGLAWDLYRLARTAGVAIDLEVVPVHRDAQRLALVSGYDPRWHALHDGEDHELVATVPAAAVPRLEREAKSQAAGFAVIGQVRSGRGLRVPEGALEDGRQEDGAPPGGESLKKWKPGSGGWRHGVG